MALPVGAPVVRKLREAQEQLERAIASDAVRWCSPEQVHLTLKFLGSVSADALAELESALRRACEGSPSFQLVSAGTGAFPSLRHPRVLWAGLDGELEVLKTLQERIESAVSPWAQKEEGRPFQPHLTLGRLREKAGRPGRRLGEQWAVFASTNFGAWQVSEVLLMRSQLSPQGSTHSKLASVALGPASAQSGR